MQSEYKEKQEDANGKLESERRIFLHTTSYNFAWEANNFLAV